MLSRFVKSSSIVLILFGGSVWANDIFLEAYGDSIELSLIQKNGQDNDLDVYVNGNYNTVNVVQDGNYNTFTIEQTGTQPTTTNVYQNGDNFSATVTQYCTTQGGCSVTVTQN